MSRGYVYILSNPSMPGLFKIGKTTRSVEQRANELYQTGVPTPFVVDHSVLSPDCDELEARLHALFSVCRVNGSREFFKITRDDIHSLPDELDHCLRNQVQEYVNEYLFDHSVMRSDFIVDDNDVEMISSQTDYHIAEVASALCLITPDELEPAMQRFKSQSKIRRLNLEARRLSESNVVDMEAVK